MIIGVFQIPVRSKGSHEFAASAFGNETAANLFRDVLGILGIEDVLQRQHHVILSLEAVHIVIDGNKADTLSREDTLKIEAHLDVISAETGQILDDHAVDHAAVNVSEHFLKRGALEVRAGVAIVRIVLYDSKVVAPGTEILHEALLIDNTVALGLVPVFTGQARVTTDFVLQGGSHYAAPLRSCTFISALTTSLAVRSPM